MAVYNMAVYYTVFWPYPTVRYGTVYGRILGEDTVRPEPKTEVTVDPYVMY